MGWQFGATVNGRFVRLLKFIPEAKDGAISRAREAASQSMNFTHAWDRCFEERRHVNSTTLQIAIVPGIVCAAFAIELAFKALIYDAGGTALKDGKKIHTLSELFYMLLEAQRAEIVAATKVPRGVFDMSLRQIDKLFIEMRYYYEQPTPIEVDVEFVKRLTLAVEPLVHVILGKKVEAQS